jgi:hypothetical protein
MIAGTNRGARAGACGPKAAAPAAITAVVVALAAVGEALTYNHNESSGMSCAFEKGGQRRVEVNDFSNRARSAAMVTRT